MPFLILDSNYVHFLQFQRDFIPQAELKLSWLETSKSANSNIVPSPNTKNHLLSLSEVADRKLATNLAKIFR